MSRRTQALRVPDEAAFNFRKFPRRTLRAGGHWFRQHRERVGADRGAWFFASCPPGVEGEGRFDLPAPHGTCYLATTSKGAVNELIGPEAAVRGWVDADLVAGRVVSRLLLPGEVRAANVSSERAADFRVTRELVTTEDYGLSQHWAKTFHKAEFGGIVTELRFTPGPTRGLALFGAAGIPDPLFFGDPEPRPVRPIVERRGIDVIDPPSFAGVAIVNP